MSELHRISRRYLEPPEEPEECPECPNGTLIHDTHERSVECDTCEYADGFDWDAEAERRAEARELDREERWL